MADERERLQWMLRRLRATLADADGPQAKSEGVAAWLRALGDLAFDIEDVLDEFEYEDLRCTVEGEGGSSCADNTGTADDVSLLPPQEDQVPEQVSFPGADSACLQVMAGRIAGIWRRIEQIMADKEALDMLGDQLDREEAERMESADNTEVTEPTFSVPDPEMLGRDREKDETTGFLLGSPTDDLSVLAIVGIGGVGKTTLALSAYNDGEVADYFDLRIWIRVSYNFDVERITKQIVRHVTDPRLMLHEIDSFDVLQVTVANSLRDRCFLLVLDDMWYEDGVIQNHTAWEVLCAPLLCGRKGSKILVTTRTTQVVGVMQPVKTIKLDGLGAEESWSLFKKHAFPDGDVARSPDLEGIGKGIVEKLNGVPLAIVAIGSLLRSASSGHEWTGVLQSELWELEQGEGGILPALRLSYEHLQPHLKPCFTFCSVYDKGHEYDRLALVQQWMALGYIRPRWGRRMEEAGDEYLNSLMNRSLIQFLDGKYIVHDLLHDLGRSILQRDYCAVASDKLHGVTVEDQQMYHLSIVHERVDVRDLVNLPNFGKLRTCIFEFSHKLTLQIPPSLFLNMACLRVLDVCGGGVPVLSDSIYNLKHLRFLDLTRIPVRYLPESLCSLYMLQTLKLQGCEQLQVLPKNMCNLINLRHLEAKHELVSGIFQIGRLVHLQEIEVFSVSEGNGIKIEDLKDMNELRGRLCIKNLHRVRSKEEASLANLSSKRYVNRLELEWVEGLDGNERNSEVEEEVLDALEPPPRLKELTVKYYDGERFPWWMEHQSVSGLESISLCRCQRWDALPPLVGLLPFLKKLEISYFPRLIELPPLPTTLTHLTLEGVGLAALPELQELPSLQELIICNIPELKDLSPLPPALRVFIVEKLGLITLPAFHQVHGGQTVGGANNFSPPLRELKIAGCKNLRSLGGVLREQLPSLRKLSIEDCEELMCWPEEEGFRATLLSIQELSIQNCPKLVALPEGSVLSPSMKKLTVEGCPGFPDSSFFVQLQDMKNLAQQGDVYVEKQYQDLAWCSEEALKHMRSINWLIVQFICQENSEHPSVVSLEYDIQPIGRRGRVKLVSYKRLVVKITRNMSGDDEDCSSILSTCLRHRQLCSSLLSLGINSAPNGAFLLPQGRAEGAFLAPDLPSLEELVMVNCADMRSLPVDTLLCGLRQLKLLSLVGCPELTLPSMEEALQTLPSLEKLVIIECPMLSPPNPDAHAHGGDREKTPPSSSPAASSSSFPSSSPALRSIAIDDVGLLADRQFTGNYLSSLHELALFYSDIESFPAAAEECLGSLRSLSLIKCPNLRELPPDFRSLVPYLEALCIKECPRLRCVPETGMPASLEVLAIYTSRVPEEDDWAKVAHVRLIIMDRKIVQGSYSHYQELVNKGRIALLPF